MKQTTEGRGISNVPLSTEEQNEIRRAKKRSQRGARPGSGHFSFDEEQSPHELRRTAQERVARTANNYSFRCRQVERATHHPLMLSLVPGSVARQYAANILLAFADVRYVRPQTRTGAAAQVALSRLLPEERNSSQVQQGGRAAFAALNSAFKRLTEYDPREDVA